MDTKETGFIVIGFGTLFFLVGAAILVDKAMVISGNILIIVGAFFLMEANLLRLFSLKRLQGTIFFTLGMFFLFKGYLVVGFFLEMVGLCMIAYDKIPRLRSVPGKLVLKAARLVK